MTEREDYDEDEMIERLVSTHSLERVLRALKPRDVLDYYKPEERLAGLGPAQVMKYYRTEDVLPALPLEVLRQLPDEYVRTLPEHVQRAIRARLAGGR